MNMVASVTTIGCMRSAATKKPLNAPAAMPMATPAARTTSGDSDGSCSEDASATLTREIVAPAERSNPPERMTIVWPVAASANVAPLAAIWDKS